jgi:hypothetical protein
MHTPLGDLGLAMIWKLLLTLRFQIQPDNIEVDRVATRVSNGEVWILKGVINYE